MLEQQLGDVQADLQSQERLAKELTDQVTTISCATQGETPTVVPARASKSTDISDSILNTIFAGIVFYFLV